MTTTASRNYIMTIGEKQLSAIDVDSDRVTMPSSSSSHPPAQPTSGTESINTSKSNSIVANMVFIVLQHSRASGNSALLPVSNIVGIFQTLGQAMKFLHGLKDKHRPLIKDRSRERPATPQFWNTSGGEGADELGYQYVSEYGEEYLVWIEQHVIESKLGEENGEMASSS